MKLLLPLIVAATVWHGAATWYGHPYIGRETRSGEVYTGQEMTAAVSSDLWDRLKGKTVLVCRTSEDVDNSQECVAVRVNDTGDAEKFAKHGVVIDLSVRAFREFGPLGLGRVQVIVKEAE